MPTSIDRPPSKPLGEQSDDDDVLSLTAWLLSGVVVCILILRFVSA